MIKIGLVSGSNISQPHLTALQSSNDFELVGQFSPNNQSNEQHLDIFPSFENLLTETDAIGILSPTFSHYEYASKAIRNLKHVFIENPISKTLDEAKSLISLSEEAEITVQIGHAERFNPAFLAVKDIITSPIIIESKRFETPSNAKRSVIFDLMIHDIDIILSTVKSSVKRIRANGFSSSLTHPEVVNARLEFDNGCVANLSASIVATKAVKKLHVFEHQKQISINFLDNQSKVIDLNNGKILNTDITEKNFIQSTEKELKSFADAIHKKSLLDVTISDGYDALNIATQIIDKLKLNSKVTI